MVLSVGWSQLCRKGLLWPPVTLCFHFWHKQLIAVDFWLLQDVSPTDAMFSKNALPKLDEEPDPHRRLKANVRDLFLTNQVSAARAASLFSDAASAGVQALQDVAGLEAKANRNVHRDLLRKLAKKSNDWPRLYWAKIDFWHHKKQKVQKECWLSCCRMNGLARWLPKSKMQAFWPPGKGWAPLLNANVPELLKNFNAKISSL